MHESFSTYEINRDGFFMNIFISKNKSKLFIITEDFYLKDEQISKSEKDWLYPQMIKAITQM